MLLAALGAACGASSRPQMAEVQVASEVQEVGPEGSAASCVADAAGLQRVPAIIKKCIQCYESKL